MSQQHTCNKYDWNELRQYLEGYVNHHTKLLTDNKPYMQDMNWTDADARLNTIHNLEKSVQIVFPELYPKPTI